MLMKRKSFAMVAVGLAMASTSAFGAGSYIQSFESDTLGELPSDWIVRFSGGGTYASNTISAVGDQSLKMVGLSYWANEIYTAQKYPISQGKTAVLSFSIYIDSFNPSADGCAGTSVSHMGDAGILSGGIRQQVPGGPLMIVETSIEAQVQTWYHFVCVADYVTGTSDTYVNGELVIDDRPMDIVSSSDVRFQSLALHTGCTNTGSVVAYIDQISLVGETCPADINGDSSLDFFDISEFLSQFGAGCP